jgi:hypothetical protein
MSESRVRENRTHGSMRRREATPDQSATAARPPEASRRPYPWGDMSLLDAAVQVREPESNSA